jgi:hypothetical protein
MSHRQTLELTGRAFNIEIIQVLDDNQASTRSGSLRC